MEIPDQLPEVDRRTVVIVVVVLFALAVLGVYIGNPQVDDESEAQFELNITENEILVTQTQGEFVDSVEIEISYINGETESFNVSISDQNGSSTITPTRPIGEISQSSLLYNGEVRTIAELPNELTPDKPTIDAIENRSIPVGSELQLNAENFTNSAISIESYEWSMGDETSYAESQITHQYEQSGNYSVELSVTDIRGNSTTESFQVTVEDSENENDSVDLILETNSMQESIQINEEFSINAEAFTHESVTSYNWMMGDGTEYQEPQITHTYDSAGSYTIMLEVSSDEKTETKEYTINVSDVSVNPDLQVVNTDGLQVTVSGQNSESDGVIETYQWNFGDGTSIQRSISEAQHEYDSNGTYTITLTTITESGVSSTVSEQITVEENTTNNDDNTDNDDNDDNTTDDSGVTIHTDFNTTHDGYIVESVSPSARTDELLATGNTGEENPYLHLEVGNRYVFDMDAVAFEHPFVIKNESGEHLLSMDSVGTLENNSGVNWVEEGNTIKFTVTEELINRADTYSSSSDELFGSDIVEYEDVDVPDNVQPDVTIVMDNDAEKSWQVTDVTGSQEYDDIVPEARPSDPNPTIHLQTGVRYRFEGIPNGHGEEDLKLGFQDLVGQYLLSQGSEGSFETSPEVAWVDDETAVEFTMTEDLGSEMEYYAETANETAMKGEIIID